MVQFTIEVNIHPDRLMEFFQTLDSLVITFRKEKDCLRYDYCFDAANPNHCTIKAEWKNLEQLKKHLRDVNFTILLGAINLLCQEHQMKIKSGHQELGPAFIRKVRENL